MAASMALQVVVSPFLGVLFDNLTSPILKEVGLIWGVDRELKKLASTVSAIQAVLEDAENKQPSKAISDWLLKLKDTAYDADDILDEWETVSMEEQRDHHTDQACGSLLSRFSFEQIKFRHKLGKRMSEINQRFDDIASQRSMFGLNEGTVERRVELYPNRITSSILTDSEIYGRKEDIKYILKWLLNNAGSAEELSIFPILGIGGLGKTTLAQSVFNDEKVMEHFDIRIWVCVSNNFDLTKLTRAVLDSIPGDSCNSEQLDALQRRLQGRLTGKRFLLVLDDVWNENQVEWNRFKFSLKCGAKGSSAIVTTRLETVASITGTCPNYSLKSLSEDDCWALFKRSAFGLGNEESLALVKIGKEIVKKCGGVPLAAKVLGGLMRFKTEECEWLYIKDSRIWDLPQSSENTILPALRLSYTHLSPHLRQCFAYCSLFPQDFKMKKEEVINLWMANGLFQPKEGMEMEDIGNEIFKSLVWRSLFQVKEEDKDIAGNTISFAMHDLIHDLSCFVAKNECYNLDWGHHMENVPNGTRHLSVRFKVHPSSSMFQATHQSTPKLRTLILDCQNEWGFPTHGTISTFRFVRALSMLHLRHDGKRTVISQSIGNLKHLRYLNLSESNFKYLPNSISRLRNLQTLKLESCYELQVLPKRLSNLSNLRHLDIRGCHKLSKMPIDMRKMTCLKTLSIFIVGLNEGNGIKELERMDYLRGELMIRCLENVRSRGDAECAALMRKKKLDTLHLAWSHRKEGENDRDVIEGLRPDSNIRRLLISEYQGICFPSWLEYSTLPNLVEISLRGCTRCEPPHSLGRLPLLKILYVGRMPSVKFLFHSDGEDVVNRFPSLEQLTLDEMPELEDWCLFKGNGGSEGQMFLPRYLKKMSIYNCPKLKRAPWPPSIETLRVKNCNEMVLGSVKNLPRLSSLTISSFNEVTCFPQGSLQNLTALKHFNIYGFKQLKILPMELGDLSKLTTLNVEHCEELVSMPEETRKLSSLQALSIGPCKKLKSLPQVGRSSPIEGMLQSLVIDDCPNLEWASVGFEHFLTLRHLGFAFFSEMTSLPDGIQNLSSTLQALILHAFDSLTSLPEWIGCLTELRYLDISQCKKLRMLPEGLRCLTNLKDLMIRECHPDLHRRCQNRKGEDWCKISHIPHLFIEDRR